MTMAMVRRVCWILALVGLSVWGDRPASACSCINKGAPCEAASRSGLIFRGRVLSIDAGSVSSPAGADGRSWPNRRVTFAVAESLQGDIMTPQVAVVTGLGGADCGYAFHEGEEYVVYTYERRRGEPPLETGICTRTRPVREADEDLAYLRSLKTGAGTPSGRIFGIVAFNNVDFDKETQDLTPDAGVPVRLMKDGAVRSMSTDETGAFEFSGLSAGKYQLEVQLADIHKAWDGAGSLEIELPSSRACVNASVFLRLDGRVSGHVVDADGAGVPDVVLELVSARRTDDPRNVQRVDTRTRADGSFELTKVPPGRYVLGINMRFDYRARRFSKLRLLFPGVDDVAKARVVEIGPGERVGIPDFVLPRGFAVNAIVR